jgi:TonB family protein
LSACLALVSLALSVGDRHARAQDFNQRPPSAPDARPAPVLTRPPRLVEAPQPVYPPEALAQGLSADVTLQLDLDAAGKVSKAVVANGAGHGFDEAAQEAATRMTFEPAEIDGQPGPIRIEYTMHFRPALPSADGGAPPDAAPPPPPPPPPTRVVVQGQLREKGTRDPIIGASVSLLQLESATPEERWSSTDDDGRFSLQAAAPPGTRVRVTVSSGEHDPCIRELVLGQDSTAISCLVAQSHGPRYETVVDAPGEHEEATRHVLSQSELTTVPGTFGDPLRVIQNLPGVARSPYGLGLLIIRGSSPQDSGVYVDGHKVPLLYHFLAGPSVLTPDLIDKIDFFPGGFGVHYGRATAGVVDVTTRNEPVRRFHGSADVDFLDSSVYLETPVGDSTSAGLAVRRSYIDAILPAVIPRQQGSSTAVVTPVYWDYQGRVTRPLGQGRLSLFAFGSNDSLKVITSDPDRGNIDLGTTIGFHRVIAAYASPLGGWTSLFSPAYGYDHFTFGAGEVSANLSSQVLGLREDLTRPLTSWLKLATGFDGELRFDRFGLNVPMLPERRTYGRPSLQPTPVERRLTNTGLAAYLEALIDLGPVRLVPGLRGDWFHYAGVDRTSADPRIVVSWTARPGQVFKVGAGIFHQPPQPQQLDTQFGNPRLKLLWADQYHLGLDQTITRAISIEGTLYYLRRHDMPLPSSRLTAGGFERWASEGRGRSYGLEVRLRHAVTANFYGWISYTLSRSEATTELPVAGQPAPAYSPTQFDQTHNLIVVASRRFGAWELGARFRLVSGIPETPILGSTYDADFNSWDPVMGAPGSRRRQTFHQLDVRIERTFTFDAWRFSIYLDVQNVYNAQNPEATIYDYRYQRAAPIRGLPFLPILGLKGRF